MSSGGAPAGERLSMAERHYREAERRVAHQEALISKLALHGHDTSLSQALLDTMRVTLQLMREHAEHAKRRRESATAPPE